MPEVKEAAAELIGLYERCKAHNALPYPGGVLDQPEWIMQAFDTIDHAKNTVRRENEDRAMADYERSRQLQGDR
jgi:hypothetical protein